MDDQPTVVLDPQPPAEGRAGAGVEKPMPTWVAAGLAGFVLVALVVSMLAIQAAEMERQRQLHTIVDELDDLIEWKHAEFQKRLAGPS
ncbi:MAG: hypothetical protein AB7F89_18040, partial [Pirellulaceae bacterium]